MRKFRNVSKRVACFSLCGIMMAGLTACGSAKSENSMAYDAMAPVVEESTMAWDGGGYYDAEMPMEEGKAEFNSGATTTATGEAALPATTRKVIKTANLNLQTLNFDEFAKALDQKIKETGAYLQYADVSGSDYYGGRKSANYTIRVPEAKLDLFLEGMEGIATVTNKTLGEEDVTLSYVDTESRIKTLEIEQERLLALLEKADDLESIILLEQRLSEVRYQMESYQSKLRTYNDRITYSTVYIYIREVNRVTEKEPETVWERIRNGWADTIYDITTGTQDFLVWFIVNLPYLLFWGVVVVVLVVVLKKKTKKRTRKQSVNNETELDSKE